MKSLETLKNESKSIHAAIKVLLLDNYRYDHSLTKQLNVNLTVDLLREKLAIVQREMRERLLA